jgi:hypothetical protein
VRFELTYKTLRRRGSDEERELMGDFSGGVFTGVE